MGKAGERLAMAAVVVVVVVGGRDSRRAYDQEAACAGDRVAAPWPPPPATVLYTHRSQPRTATCARARRPEPPAPPFAERDVPILHAAHGTQRSQMRQSVTTCASSPALTTRMRLAATRRPSGQLPACRRRPSMWSEAATSISRIHPSPRASAPTLAAQLALTRPRSPALHLLPSASKRRRKSCSSRLPSPCKRSVAVLSNASIASGAAPSTVSTPAGSLRVRRQHGPFLPRANSPFNRAD
ncbi:hypothetical protein K505DRAFT_422800, partial [Melanomma pulvis-pyrius CBS 109.77]